MTQCAPLSTRATCSPITRDGRCVGTWLQRLRTRQRLRIQFPGATRQASIETSEDIMTNLRRVNRRHFLKLSALVTGALGIGAAGRTAAATATPTGPVKGLPQQGGTADDMDAMHEQGVKAFVDNIGKDK